jgi:hypothetical protein
LSFYRYTHPCEPHPQGTRHTDQVEYQSLARAPSDWLIVRPYMRRIFMVRHANMRSPLGAAS